MAIPNFNEKTQTFSYDPSVDLAALAATTEKKLFSKDAFHVIKGFIDPSVAERMRVYFADQNAEAFRVEHSPLFRFHGQSLIVYYPRSPFKLPSFLTSAYREISLFRNRVYANQKFYLDYCKQYGLPPKEYETVYNTQVHHTWSRISWYKETDGQCPHVDMYGEIAAFVFLSKKGQHWREGGLYFYDETGKKTLEVDALCEPGDLLFLDQNNAIHGVEPVLGATPGRMLMYIPIIPAGYMKPWFTFEGHPNEIFFSNPKATWFDRASAILSNFFSKPKVHYSRRKFPLKTFTLPPAATAEEKKECVLSQ